MHPTLDLRASIGTRPVEPGGGVDDDRGGGVEDDRGGIESYEGMVKAFVDV